MMFRRMLVLLAAVCVFSGTGCINQYASDPVIRMDQHINESENLRQISDFWRRFWFNDQPSHMVPERIHGGIL